MQKQVYTKKDIVRRTSYKFKKYTKDELKVVLDCFLNVVKDMFIEDKDRIHLEIRNFGTFDIVPTKIRKNARNPRTKEKVVIQPRKKITFKPSKIIKKYIYKSRLVD